MEITKKQLTIGMIITLLLAVSGTYYLSQEDNAYYCGSKDMVMICEKLSSGLGTRCYFENTYKTCAEGWVKMDRGEFVKDEIQLPSDENIPSSAEGMQWKCSPEECTRVK